MAEQSTVTPATETKPDVGVKTTPETGKGAETIKTAETTKTETKAVETKPDVKTEVKTEAKTEPAKELKSLLEEAGDEEIKTEGETKVAPDKYEPFKLPEGISLNEAQLNQAEIAFRKLGLNQEQAQELVDLQLAMNKANEDAHVQSFNEYVEWSKKDTREHFGDNFKTVMKTIGKAKEQFVHKELMDKLVQSGFSNDKDFLIMLDKVGRVVGEGKFVEGRSSGSEAEVKEAKTKAVSFYPTMRGGKKE